MKYRRLGKTGLNVSVIGLGTMQLGGEWGKHFTDSEVDRIISVARDCGINFIDTAECYGDHLAESLLARGIRAHRKDWIVATKFGHRFLAPFEREERWQPIEVQRQLEASLTALKTDYVDIYQFHSGGMDAFHNEAIWDMLYAQVKEGKIRHLGLSPCQVYMDEQIQSALSLGIRVVQVRFNRLENDAAHKTIPFCQENNLGVIARVPLASGFLGGNYPSDAIFPKHDIRSQTAVETTRSKLTLANQLLQVEAVEGKTKAQWALTWCLRHAGITCAIPGCKSTVQVLENALAADFEETELD